jgi:F0F1-type ATP synthase membrane subunit b/b'
MTTSAGLMQPMTFWQLVRFHVLVAVTAQVVLMAVGGFFKRRLKRQP